MKSKIINQLSQKDTELNSVIETILETETIIQMLESNYYQKSMENADIADVNINHLENIFTNETYYLAMKIVPLIESSIFALENVYKRRCLVWLKKDWAKVMCFFINKEKSGMHNIEIMI